MCLPCALSLLACNMCCLLPRATSECRRCLDTVCVLYAGVQQLAGSLQQQLTQTQQVLAEVRTELAQTKAQLATVQQELMHTRQ